jgi:hypothetical protein
VQLIASALWERLTDDHDEHDGRIVRAHYYNSHLACSQADDVMMTFNFIVMCRPLTAS